MKLYQNPFLAVFLWWNIHSKPRQASFLENLWGVSKNMEFQNPFGATSGLYFAALLKIIEDDLLLSSFCHVGEEGQKYAICRAPKEQISACGPRGQPSEKSHTT